MTMVAQLIKTFHRILWNLQFITEFMFMSFNTLPKAQIVKIHPDKVPSNYFNIILLSFPFSYQKSVQDYLHSHPCPIPYPLCHSSLIPQYLTSSINYETPYFASFSSLFLCL